MTVCLLTVTGSCCPSLWHRSAVLPALSLSALSVDNAVTLCLNVDYPQVDLGFNNPMAIHNTVGGSLSEPVALPSGCNLNAHRTVALSRRTAVQSGHCSVSRH